MKIQHSLTTWISFNFSVDVFILIDFWEASKACAMSTMLGFNFYIKTSYLVPVCWGNVIVLCSQVRCCHNEVHVEIGVIILLR